MWLELREQVRSPTRRNQLCRIFDTPHRGARQAHTIPYVIAFANLFLISDIEQFSPMRMSEVTNSCSKLETRTGRRYGITASIPDFYDH